MGFRTEDVLMVINTLKGRLILIAAALAAMIICIIVTRKFMQPNKRFVRIQAIVAFLLITVICANTILLGTYYNTLNTYFADKLSITDESRAASADIVEQVVDEGIVLAQNNDGLLPIAGKKLNVFGWAVTNPIYGGSGSGASDESANVSIIKGLENSGIEINTSLIDFYKAYREDRPAAGTSVQDFTLPEPTASSYTEELLGEAVEFSDTAMIVLGRVGGECFDLPTDMSSVIHNAAFNPESNSLGLNGTYVNNGDYDDFEAGQHYLTLSRTEQDLVDLVCSRFDNVVLLYNGNNPFELGWTEQYSQIKSILLCPGTGATGFNSLGKILTGEVNPSGSTVDTWVYDFKDTPYYNNFGDFHYSNLADYSAEIVAADVGTIDSGTFVNYVENIYVGYKFYETAAKEGFLNYDETVKYPFGFGLSYTDFTQTMSDLTVAGDEISFDVTVTNTGSTAGKDVVEVYFTPPYTNGGIEKASVNLVNFEKTGLLEPGQSETIHISFSKDDMASFDAHGAGCYVLEAGDYAVSIRDNSHDVFDERIYTQKDTETFNDEARSTDDVTAVACLQDAEGDVTYLSRADHFANYEAACAAPSAEKMIMSDETRATYISNANYDVTTENNADDVMPAVGVKNDLKLAELRGADYDDPRWETLLNELTFEEMSGMITFGGWSTNEIATIGKVATNDCDGPAGVNNFFTGNYGSSYCVETMLAQTWSKELARAFGEGLGQEFDDIQNYGWYGPAMNTHRSAFGGRNFEYYSEDGVLSGYIAAAEVNGAASKGVYAYIKHFALNDQETNCRSMLCTWASEQAIREQFLKPFEICVKNYEGQGLAVMNSFNFIGTTWSGASHALLSQILRDEWGFKGFVCTDYFGGYGYMNAERGIRAGTDLMLNMVSEFANITDQSATGLTAVRRSTKNVLYTVVNSGAYFEENIAAMNATPGWVMKVILADCLAGLIILTLEFWAIRFLKRKYKVEIEHT